MNFDVTGRCWMHTSLAEHTIRRPHYLRIDAVATGYNNTRIVESASVVVGRGEVVSIIGPNGAGKSTLLKALAGHLRILEGHVFLGDDEVTNLPPSELARKGLGYVPQVNDVFPDLTVRENLEMGGYLLSDRSCAARITEVIEIFPIVRDFLNRPALKLSGGERKIVAIARALMLSPTLLVLDEPTASLSPKFSADLLQKHVRKLALVGTAVLLVEQKAAAALEISDWAYVMVSGKMRLEGPTADLLAREDFAELFLGGGLAESESSPADMMSP